MESQTIVRMRKFILFLCVVIAVLVIGIGIKNDEVLESQKNVELLSNDIESLNIEINKLQTTNDELELTLETRNKTIKNQKEQITQLKDSVTELKKKVNVSGNYNPYATKSSTKNVVSLSEVKLQYSAAYAVSTNPLTASKGVVYFNGHKETYYSQKVLPGNGLSIPGRHVADDGTIRDGDGYIVVSTDLSFYKKGSTFMTSLGPAKVYDTGCAYGVVDIYCNW